MGTKRWVRGVAGMTLIEIIVGMFIITLSLGIVISRMDNLLEWDMKKAANKLAATMRYLYNKSASEGIYIRLIIDLEEQVYWVEATTDPFVISTGEEGRGERNKQGVQGGEGLAEETEAGLAETEGGEGVPPLKPKEPVFTKVDSYLLKPTKLPGLILFKDVYVEHEPTAVAGGQVAIHFFPNGYMEYAIINLRDEDDEINYSLETNPISGQVSIETRYRAMEE